MILVLILVLVLVGGLVWCSFTGTGPSTNICYLAILYGAFLVHTVDQTTRDDNDLEESHDQMINDQSKADWKYQEEELQQLPLIQVRKQLKHKTQHKFSASSKHTRQEKILIEDASWVKITAPVSPGVVLDNQPKQNPTLVTALQNCEQTKLTSVAH